METESAGLDPQEHLRQFDKAADAARWNARQPTPLWFWSVMALMAPLVVSFRSTTGSTRLALVAAFAAPVLIALAVVWRQGNRRRSRERSGFAAYQQAGAVWKFFGLFFFITGIQMSLSLISVDVPIRTAIFTYLFIAIPCTFFFWKFDSKQLERTTLPGKPR